MSMSEEEALRALVQIIAIRKAEFIERCEGQADLCDRLAKVDRDHGRPLEAASSDGAAIAWRGAAVLARLMLDLVSE